MPLDLRLPGESDDAFQMRAVRASRIARLLVDACFANECLQQYIADDSLPTITEESLRRSPTVRVEYEQAIAIGDIGSTLSATKNKHWGSGPQILPLQPTDCFYPDRVTYCYRTNSVYNRRFEQRQRLKELLGRRWRPLVEDAKRFTKTIFLEHLTARQAEAIRNCIGVDPGTFWRAVNGRFLTLPGREVQLTLPFDVPTDE